MNKEQVQQGRDVLISSLSWEAESISQFAKALCEREVKKEIASGLVPYLTTLRKDLIAIESEISKLLAHIEEFNNETVS